LYLFCGVAVISFLVGWGSKDGFTTLSGSLSRNDWDKEYQQHLEKVKMERELERKDWDEEYQRHSEKIRSENAQRELKRKEWDKEYQQHSKKMQAANAQWERERKDWLKDDRAREKVRQAERLLEVERQRKKDREKEEDKQRKKATVQWAKLQPDQQCLRYGIRKWTAKLENVPSESDPISTCQKKKAWIHGLWVLPDDCMVVRSWIVHTRAAAHLFPGYKCRNHWDMVHRRSCVSHSLDPHQR
jgi:hypothetical protein